MRAHQQDLIQWLSPEVPSTNLESIEPFLEQLSADQKAEFFVDVAYLVSAMQFVKEQHWLYSQAHTNEFHFSKFIKIHLKQQLKPLLFLHSFFENLQIEHIDPIRLKAEFLTKTIIRLIKTMPYEEQRQFAISSLRLMSELFEHEHQLEQESEGDQKLSLSLHHTFDILDEVFNLNYEADEGMTSKVEQPERLFEGAGVGVQSSYGTILMMLRYLKIPPKARFIDLGSGYGRVGIVIGLMRPDVEFIGYEYVPHRVELAKKTTQNLGLTEHVSFHAQDLAAKEFQIPDAHVYYIYDSFCEKTYGHVLSQLIQTGQKSRITVVTKGDAKQWLSQATQKGNWSHPQQFTSGNFCLFRST